MSPAPCRHARLPVAASSARKPKTIAGPGAEAEAGQVWPLTAALQLPIA
jgi:hypothetical protein